jgi:hypothetical protein
MTSRALRLAAGVVALAYIAVQGFQEYVFRTMAAPASPAEGLMQGAATAHVVRSSLMLAAMFGLVFLHGVLCLHRARERPVLAAAGFLGFLLFGALEIGLRSVELFWTQLQLPAAYAAQPDPAILERLATFQAVQGALYAPLMAGFCLGSVALFVLYTPPPRADLAVRLVAGANILRNLTRFFTGYAGIPLFPDTVYEPAYFPMVIALYAPLAWWLLRARDPG